MMFKRIETTEDILSIKPYLDMYEKDFSDLTCPNFFMWRNYYPREYCFIDDTLIIKECSASDENDFRFYMPVGKNPEIVFAYIESYCAKKAVPLCFSNLTVDEANIISARYVKTKVCYDRCWSDYVYNAEDMRFFKGKKFAGQRNHINKFISLYGNYQYHQITRDNISAVKNFLIDLRDQNQFQSDDALDELNLDISFLDVFFEFSAVVGGFITCGEKVISVAIGEKRGNTLYVCIEKANREYIGAYQVIVKEFALHNTDDEVCFINREDDMGKEGLRISKLQYHPIEIKNKYWVEVNTLFDEINAPVRICSEENANVFLDEITSADAEAFMRLYTDDDNNKYWGYDYKEDAPIDVTAQYFIDFAELMKKKKEEYSLAVRVNGVFAGEGVFHNFDVFGNVELGIRLLREFQGKGIASCAVVAMNNYAKNILRAKTVKMKCFLQNTASERMIKKAGFAEVSRDDNFIFFEG